MRCFGGLCLAVALLGPALAARGERPAAFDVHHGLVAHAQSEIVLDGLPRLRISENGVVRSVESIERSEAEADACLIQRIGDRYYWTTDENGLDLN